MAKKKKDISESDSIAFDAMAFLNKQFGAKTIKRATESVAYDKRQFPSGSLMLDLASGYSIVQDAWGFPTKGVIELCGREGAGKTTLSLLACRHHLDSGGYVVYNCLETTGVDSERMLSLGLDIDSPRFMHTFPEKGTNAWDLILAQLDLGLYSLIVLDSLATLSSKAEDEMENMADSVQMGGASNINAIAMRKVFNKLSTLCNRADRGEKVVIGTKKTDFPVKIPVVIITNQVRDSLGGYDQYQTPGGTARKHLELLRVGLTNLTTKEYVFYDNRQYISISKDGVKDEKNPLPTTSYKTGDSGRVHLDTREIFGNDISFEILKNKTGVPNKRGMITILHSGKLGHRPGEIFVEKEIFFGLVNFSVILRGAKGWYNYKGNNYREEELIRAFSTNRKYFCQLVYDLATNDLLRKRNKEIKIRIALGDGDESELFELKQIPDNIFENVDFTEIRREMKEEKDNSFAEFLKETMVIDEELLMSLGNDSEEDSEDDEEGSVIF